jgi:Dna[CI] antecedent, DciA
VAERPAGRQDQVPDQVRLAREALAAARAQARAKGLRPAGPARPGRAGSGSAGGAAYPPDRVDVDAADAADVPFRPQIPAQRRDSPDGSGQAAADQASADQARAGQAGLAPLGGPALGGRARPGRDSLRRFRRDDPQALGTAIEGLLDSEGWNLAAATGSVFGRWAQIVGPELADHTEPESLRDGELTVVADSTAWATQLRLLAAQLVKRLNAELGNGTVSRVKVRGPVAAARKPGEWRVRGSRGPRDTYG